jgi:pterin-4a-carbinolamine dehydratase
MPRPDDIAVAEGLQHLPDWQRCGNQIVKTFIRADLAHAMVFVNEVAVAAEAATTPTSTSAGTRSPWRCLEGV